MWWTLARPAEATEAEWTEFDLDNALWTIPAARMKACREHVIPLPFQAVKMLRTLQGLTGHRHNLFPGRDNPLGPMTSHSLRQLLKSLGWSGTYSPHATRTTGSTRWAIDLMLSKLSLRTLIPTMFVAHTTMQLILMSVK